MAEPRLELRSVEASVVLCLAAPAALDRLGEASSVMVGRVAPDELLLLDGAGHEDDMVGAARDRLRESDTDALVLDLTDGWSGWLLAGPDAEVAFGRMSSVPLTAVGGFAQGAICGVGAKVLVVPAGVCMLVSSSQGHHVRDRALEMCGDLGVSLGPAWDFDPAGARR